MRAEETASGISPERTELDILLGVIFQREEKADNVQQATDDEKKKKNMHMYVHVSSVVRMCSVVLRGCLPGHHLVDHLLMKISGLTN